MEVVASPLLDDHYSWEDVPTSCSSKRRGQTRRHGGEDEIACALDLSKLGSWRLVLYCSRVLAWTIVVLLSLIGQHTQKTWWWLLPWHGQKSLQGQGKRMVHRRRESLHSCWLLDPLIFCNHGNVMGRFALHDWERMVFGPCFSFSNFAISQGPKGSAVVSGVFLDFGHLIWKLFF